jgi:hypothetical protein
LMARRTCRSRSPPRKDKGSDDKPMKEVEEEGGANGKKDAQEVVVLKDAKQVRAQAEALLSSRPDQPQGRVQPGCHAPPCTASPCVHA